MSSAASSADSGATLEGSAATDARGICTILIPAYNEAETIDGVVEVGLRSGVGEVLVVDDGSTDGTGEAARRAGARVIGLQRNLGKGGAVAAGLRSIASETVLLVDADLVGLTPRHLQDLAAPVIAGEVDMTRGVFTGGRWRTTAAQRLTPQLNGQRAVRRDLLLRVPQLEATRYGIEVAITDVARREGWRCRDIPLEGVSQVMKEEKRGFIAGMAMRLRMYRDIFATMLRSRR
ncbi:MAG TPA: glycosyltransferase family 2 protein [Trueperaceae bacterium]